jgi:hypothetical protein
MTDEERGTLAFCLGLIDGALGSVDQSPEHKDETLRRVRERLSDLFGDQRWLK